MDQRRRWRPLRRRKNLLGDLAVGAVQGPGGPPKLPVSPISPSGLLKPDTKIGEPMTQADIDLMIEAYAQGAEAAQRVGFDGVEIHGAHGYRSTSFLGWHEPPHGSIWRRSRRAHALRRRDHPRMPPPRGTKLPNPAAILPMEGPGLHGAYGPNTRGIGHVSRAARGRRTRCLSLFYAPVGGTRG